MYYEGMKIHKVLPDRMMVIETTAGNLGIWLTTKTRKAHTCIECEKRIEDRSLCYRPLAGTDALRLRLCVVCIAEAWGDMEE